MRRGARIVLGVVLLGSLALGIGYGLRARLAAPDVYLEGGHRYIVSDFVLRSVGSVEVDPFFSRNLPDFSRLSEELQWWRLQAEVLQELRGKREISLNYVDSLGKEYSEVASVGFPTLDEIVREVWVAYFAALLLGIGSYSVLLRHRNEVGVVLGAFLYGVAFWLICLVPIATRSLSLDPGVFRNLAVLLYASSAVGWTLLHFVLVFPNRKPLIQRFPRLPVLFYVLGVIETSLYAGGWMAFGATFPQVVLVVLTVSGVLVYSVLIEEDRFFGYQIAFFIVGPVVATMGILVVCYLWAGMVNRPWMSVNSLALIFMVLPLSLIGALENITLYRARIRAERASAEERENRLNVEKRSLMEQQRLRDEIRADLHDSVLARLPGVSRSLVLARQQLADPLARVDVASSLEREIASLSQLRQRGLNLTGISKEQPFRPEPIFEMIRLSIEEILGGTKISPKFQFSSELERTDWLNGRVCAGLFQVFRHLASNCVRHADATLFEAKLVIRSNEIIGEVTDNGKGFRRTVLDLWGRGGKVADSMSWRISELRGELIRSNLPTGGASITFRLPNVLERSESELARGGA